MRRHHHTKNTRPVKPTSISITAPYIPETGTVKYAPLAPMTSPVAKAGQLKHPPHTPSVHPVLLEHHPHHTTPTQSHHTTQPNGAPGTSHHASQAAKRQPMQPVSSLASLSSGICHPKHFNGHPPPSPLFLRWLFYPHRGSRNCLLLDMSPRFKSISPDSRFVSICRFCV